VWSSEDAKKFLDHVRDERLYALWLLMLATGMRRAEVAGLRWVDVNLEAGVISIRQTRVAVDFAVFISEPKTATSRRPIALEALTLEALLAHRMNQQAERLNAAGLWQDTGFVFVREDGFAYHPERITMMFKREVRAVGLPILACCSGSPTRRRRADCRSLDLTRPGLSTRGTNQTTA
jgi:integrase